MAKLQYLRATSPNPLLRVFIQDSSKTDGSGLTGLTSSSSGLRIDVLRELDATVTSYKQASSNLETITTLGTYAAPTSGKARIKEVDSTNLPGWYEIQLAQALLGTGDASRFLSGMIWGASNVAPCPFELQLTALDVQDAVRAGLTALPNANAEAAGGLYTRGSGAGQIAQSNNGRIDSDVKSLANGIIAAATFAANALDAVWSTATRLLTAGTNIVLAKGTGVTGFTDLDAAGVRSAIGLGSANLDTQLAGIDSDVQASAQPGDAMTLTAAYDAAKTAASASIASAIKAKTDKLTFDADNLLAGNIKKVNDVALQGDGTSESPWGPA